MPAHGTRAEPQARPLSATLGGAAFLILGEAYERQCEPFGEVPMWAAPILRQGNARTASQLAFGTRWRHAR